MLRDVAGQASAKLSGMLSYDEAARQVTAAGCRSNHAQQDVMGVPRTLFPQRSNSLRDIVVTASAQRRRHLPGLRDERWEGFERFGRGCAALGTALVEQYGIGRGDRVAIAMQLPRVGRVLRRRGVGRGDLGQLQRLVDRRGDGLRPVRLRGVGADRGRRADRAQPGHV